MVELTETQPIKIKFWVSGLMDFSKKNAFVFQLKPLTNSHYKSKKIIILAYASLENPTPERTCSR